MLLHLPRKLYNCWIFVCLSVCLCVFVSKIVKKLLYGFTSHFHSMWRMVQHRTDLIARKIHSQCYIQKFSNDFFYRCIHKQIVEVFDLGGGMHSLSVLVTCLSLYDWPPIKQRSLLKLVIHWIFMLYSHDYSTCVPSESRIISELRRAELSTFHKRQCNRLTELCIRALPQRCL